MRLLSIFLGFYAVYKASALSGYPIIETQQGQVQGGASDYRENVTVYKGIPFAAPPTGAKRWTAPTLPQSHSEVLNATQFGPQCAQSYSPAGIFSTGKNLTSEDCLYLNIWTPTYTSETDISSKNLPVFYWIYGGRFEGGSGDVKTYDGSGLASKDIIVVTVNYRLGAFGFLAHPDLSAETPHNSSGNYGIMDQQFGLQWVHDNIAAFGGNPEQIVVGGQSAGSASALDMMWSPLSGNLINGVISESGARGPHDPDTASAATSYRNRTWAEAAGVQFLETMNVSSIAELRKVSTEDLIEQGGASDTNLEGTAFEDVLMEPPAWRPVIDGYVLPHGYGESLRLNAHADVPILTGNNKNEGDAQVTSFSSYESTYREIFQNFSAEYFSLYPANNLTEASLVVDHFWRDLARVGTWSWALDWAAGGAKSPVYTYYFTHAPAEDREAGAYHGAELWYTFNNIPYASYDANITWTAADHTVEERMSEYWANFIRSGNPNGGELPEFPPSTADKRQTMWLGNSWGAGPIAGSDEKIEFIENWFSVLHEF